MCVQVCVCVFACEGQKSILSVFLNHSSLLRKGLSPNPEIGSLARFAGQQFPEIHLSQSS